MLSKLSRTVRVASRHRNKLVLCQLLSCCLFVITLIVWVLVLSITNHSTLTFPPPLQKATNVLLVLAHPDDESLFFGPTILQLVRRKPPSATHLLFLSSGNHYGLGSQRKLEQKKSCATFGVESDHCKVLDLPELQDDPTAVWPHEKIQSIVAHHVDEWHIDTIITFDDGGVSGHKNHVAASDAIVAYTHSLPSSSSLVTYTLTSTTLLRKYSSLLDLPLTTLLYLWRRISGGLDSAALNVNGLGMWWRGVRAFQSHETQNSWDRRVYAVVSRYMWYNDLKVVRRVVEGGGR